MHVTPMAQTMIHRASIHHRHLAFGAGNDSSFSLKLSIVDDFGNGVSPLAVCRGLGRSPLQVRAVAVLALLPTSAHSTIPCAIDSGSYSLSFGVVIRGEGDGDGGFPIRPQPKVTRCRRSGCFTLFMSMLCDSVEGGLVRSVEATSQSCFKSSSIRLGV
jgi:hypothetical protein